MTRTVLYSSLAAAAVAVAIAVPLTLLLARDAGPDAGEEVLDEAGGQVNEPRGGPIERFALSSGLDAKQTEKLKTLQSEHHRRVRPIRRQIGNGRDAIKALWLAPTPDRHQLLAAEREIGVLEAQIAESRVELELAVRQLLGPSQFAEFLEAHEPGGGRKRAKRAVGP